MMHMMDSPVIAMMLLVGLLVVLAALTIGLRVLGGRDGRTGGTPAESATPPAPAAPAPVTGTKPPSLDK